MTRPHDPEQVFRALVHGVAEGGGAHLADLYGEHTDVVHPFDPFRSPALRSRDVLREHFTVGPDEVPLRRTVTGVTVHHTADPEVIVAEFAYAGTRPDTGEPFRIPCVFVLRVRDGRIVESRDYIDPIASARAHDRLPALLTALDDRPAAFTVHAWMSARPGRRDALAATIHRVARLCREHGGLRTHTVNADQDDPDALWVTEIWTDRATHDTVTRSAPVRAASRDLQPLLAGPPVSSYGTLVPE